MAPTRETPEQEFIRHLRQSKNKGVDVDREFVHMKEAVWLSAARVFGVVVSILWSFLGPPATIWMIIVCKREGVDVSGIPLSLVYWTCQCIGFVSILAFGFDLVKVDIRGKTPLATAIDVIRKGEVTLQLEKVEDADNGADGGV